MTKLISFVCSRPECDNAGERYKSQIRNPDRLYCSVNCKKFDESRFQQGENNSNYRGVRRVGQPRRNAKLSKEIRANNLIPYVCAECGQLPEWHGKVLTLQLDHINGEASDDRLDNLRFLCPNCHTQTDTWGHRNRKVK